MKVGGLDNFNVRVINKCHYCILYLSGVRMCILQMVRLL